MSEKISSLMDSQAHPGDIDAVLQDAEANGAANTWARYHLVGAVLRGECGPAAVHLAVSGTAERIRARLGDEPAVLAPRAARAGSARPPHGASVWQVATGLALAASVAAVAVFALRPAPAPTLALASVTARPASQADSTPRVVGHRRRNEFNLNQFLLEHGEFTTPSAMNGLVAYAKFVSDDAHAPR